MNTKKQRRLAIHWGPEMDDKVITRAKQIAVGKNISFSAFFAEALRKEVERETAREKGQRQ